MADLPPWEQLEAEQLQRRAHGAAWYDRHIETFTPAVVRDDAHSGDVELYHAAIVAAFAEETMVGIRSQLTDFKRQSDPSVPPEKPPQGGPRLLQRARDRVVRPDVVEANAWLYERCVAARAFHPYIADAVAKATALALEAKRRSEEGA